MTTWSSRPGCPPPITACPAPPSTASASIPAAAPCFCATRSWRAWSGSARRGEARRGGLPRGGGGAPRAVGIPVGGGGAPGVELAGTLAELRSIARPAPPPGSLVCGHTWLARTRSPSACSTPATLSRRQRSSRRCAEHSGRRPRGWARRCGAPAAARFSWRSSVGGIRRRAPAHPRDDLGGQLAELHVAVVRGPAQRRERLGGVAVRLGHDDADRVVDYRPGPQGLLKLSGQITGLGVAADNHDGRRCRCSEQGDEFFVQPIEAVVVVAG